ncbi:MAG: DUF1648 domain-containing protein [Gammaproteobacteria bacterium]|nr:DUF1648 domain-containing protein [Gammaproteobacteria bacterium]
MAPLLPSLVAAHFDAQGHANGWMSKAAFFYLYLGIQSFYCLLYYLPRQWLVRNNNKIINWEYWLSPEHQQKTLHTLRFFIQRFSLVSLLFMAVIFQLAMQANLVSPPQFNATYFLVLLIAYLIYIGLFILRFFKRFKL